MRRLVSLFVLLAFVGLCFGAAALGAIVTTPAIDGWYRTLEKPWWTPPDQVFGPVWTALYLAMGIAAWLVWGAAPKNDADDPISKELAARDRRDVRVALSLFCVQLGLNVAWSWIFFGLRSPGWAAVEIVVLYFAILATTNAFFRLSPIGALLLLPYLGWVTFAAALNFAIWGMNN